MLIFMTFIFSFAASLLWGFTPWGILAGIVPFLIYKTITMFPSRQMIKANVKVAIEGITFGDFDRAVQHFDSALTEAQMAKRVDEEDVALLSDACRQISDALIKAGMSEKATALRNRCEEILKRHWEG